MNVRIIADDKNSFWSTSKDVGEIAIEHADIKEDVNTREFFLINEDTPFNMDNLKSRHEEHRMKNIAINAKKGA